ncbi:MAG: protein translocase subunit SecF [Sinobacteraceae bacterium]|nr:protein translocase subunit SecF [Nevskia sp.]MDI3258879.1 protein translocase subunit SecF [Nevskiaceae bacterium]
MRIFSKVPNIDFMAQRKHALMLSGVLSVIALALLVFRGLNFGIDFRGGVLVEVSYPQSVALDEVRAELKQGGYGDAVVQYFGGTSDVLIRLPAPKDEAVGGDAQKKTTAVSARVLETLGAKEKGISLRRVEFVGPQVGQELTQDGAIALLAAFAGIFLYVMFRFEWKFSAGSIAALTHDAIMTLGFLSLVREEFDLTVLAGVLAMLGYSNNETIVIFDRVRENLINLRKRPVLEIINLSINQTLLRSIITHFTVLMVLSCLFFFGGKSVHGFAVAMMVGVVVATYSSIYISSGVTVLLNIKREDLIPPEDHALTGRSKDGAVV